MDEPLQLTLKNVGAILKITSSESIIDVSRDKGVKKSAVSMQEYRKQGPDGSNICTTQRLNQSNNPCSYTRNVFQRNIGILPAQTKES